MRRYSILLILGLALLLRLYNIDAPTIGVHQWRQSQTAMISRNFHENGYRFLYPQIDWAGGVEGYAETDFPAYSFVIAALYGVFGPENWAGRMTSVFYSLITIYFIYLLARKYIDERTALWAAFFYSILPLTAFYGRAIMPESMMLMATVAGVYFFSEWVDTDIGVCLVISWLLISLACLLKPTSLYIGLPLLYLAWLKNGSRALLRPALWAYSAAVLAAVFAWYYHAHNIRLETNLSIGLYDKWLNGDILVTAKFWNQIIVKRLLEKHFAWFGLPLFVTGLFLKKETRKEWLFEVWALAVVIYILIAGQGNYAHEYYQLPLIVPGAVLIGKVFARHFDPKKLKTAKGAVLTLCLIGITGFSIARLNRHIRQENPLRSPSFQAGEFLNKNTGDKDLIITVTDGDPSILYLSHRKGWVAATGDVNEAFIEDKVKKGAAYMVGVHWRFNMEDEKKNLDWILNSGRYRLIFSDKEIFVLKLA